MGVGSADPARATLVRITPPPGAGKYVPENKAVIDRQACLVTHKRGCHVYGNRLNVVELIAI